MVVVAMHARAWALTTEREYDPKERESIARRVDEIAYPFAGERSFEGERAAAWVGFLTQTDDPGVREVTARRVDEIARLFAGDFDFEFRRARAWCCVAFARMGHSHLVRGFGTAC